MELTAEAYLIGVIISVLGIMVLTPLFTEQYVSRRLVPKLLPKVKQEFAGFERLSDLASVYLTDEDNTQTIESAFDALTQLGVLATNANTIMNSEEMLDGLLQDFAGRTWRIAKASMMGTASGDVKKRAMYERKVNVGIIEGVKKMSPAIGLFLRLSGLDEELQNDPEAFSYIMQIVADNGLMNLFNPSMLEGMSAQESESVVRQAIEGIDF